ncbi:MAG: MATE family efflux transporter [Pleomorphochaeta sp.]
MEETNIELFEKTKISKAVWTLALPTMLAMIVTIIYNLADTFFIGQTADSNQVAAITLAMPVFMVMMSFGTLFGTGSSSTISRNLGEKKNSRVKQVSSFGFYGAIITGIIVGAILLIFVGPLTNALGASEDTYYFVVDYISYLALGAPFIIVSNAFGNIVRSDGNAKAALMGMLIGTLTNIILDPIMILGLNMGVSGAAIATVIGNIAATIYYIIYLNSKRTILSIKFSDFKVKEKIAKDVFSIGIPSSINTLLMSFSIMVLNFFLASYGDITVAAMGVATKGNQIPAMLFGGFTMGVQPLLAYAYGAKDTKRLKGIVKYTLTICIILGLSIALTIISIAPTFVKAFINDPEIIVLGTVMVRALMSTVVLLGIYFFSTIVNQAMNKPLSALILTISRQGLVFIPSLFIGNYLFGLTGLIWAQPIADIVSVIIAVFMLVKNLKAMESEYGVNKNIQLIRA